MSIITEITKEIKIGISHRRQLMGAQQKRDALAPRAGDVAPDFTLFDIAGKESVTLSDFQGKKPVALVFGSFTWPPYVKGTVSVQQIYERYHDDVQFLNIYIREAHPTDGWWLGYKYTKKLIQRIFGTKASMEHQDPKTIEERRATASECEAALDYGVRTYVDEMDDQVNYAYAAWPTRLYLIGLDGKVVYAGGQGPYDFRPAKLEAAIEEYLGQEERITSENK